MNIDQIIRLWPSDTEFAQDIGLRRPTHAAVMKRRQSIPVAYWPRIINAASLRGFQLSADDLVHAHTRDNKSKSEAA